ncbi:carboxypeptidase-like regulatory domain-containing protein [Tellurirhabdus rosea]|uniref:carboxypeptidase-like regulatory domain-containing protein n=1 Tax=Tellurirhabdus rosea TaxID=2674997 RepID=UPI002256642C|nr:carboxypeptidase regulatory-like domain-containing protein [Tellurirhabdus rosea]
MKPFFTYFLLLAAVLTGLWGCNEDFSVEPVIYSAVRGKVQFDQTRLPAKGVSVRLSPTGRTVETDSTGTFRFDTIAAGRYTVQASLPGYSTEFITVEVEAERVAVITLNLKTDRSQNRPPNAPTLVAPALGSDTSGTKVKLKWKATDPNRDTLTYTINLIREGDTQPTSYTTAADSLEVTGLRYATTYYWQVLANDGTNDPTSSPLWSFRTRAFPDLQYVFARRVNGQFQIFASNAGTDNIQLTDVGGNWRPIVSPNGERIAFISNREGDPHIYVMNRDGSNARRITGTPITSVAPTTELSFCWSPDGTQILYPSNNRLYIVSATGTFGEGFRTVVTAPDGRFFAGCDWTEQGNRIVARVITADFYDNEIWLYTPEGAGYNQRPLFGRRPGGRISNPVFSLNGRTVMFSYDTENLQTSQPLGLQENASIFLFDINSSSLLNVSNPQQGGGGGGQGGGKPKGFNDLEPRFSPNGARIIFTYISATGTGARTIWAMDVTGQNRTQLIADGENPDWR